MNKKCLRISSLQTARIRRHMLCQREASFHPCPHTGQVCREMHAVCMQSVYGKFHTGGAEIMRVKITLACTECKRRNYVSKKNKKNDPDRIEMMKHCRFCNKHTLHKETK